MNAKQAELDMDNTIRYFQYTAINSPDEAETVRDEAVEVVTQLRDLLFELSSLEIDLVDGLLDYYGIKL
jgi:hypothetical protein